LASRLSAWQQDGVSYARLRMEVKQPPGTTKSALQIQIKARRTKMNTEVVYQILWPKERKGEAVLLRKPRDRSASGSIFVPPDTARPIDASEMKEPLFDSDLSYQDAIENVYGWKEQAIVGSEAINGVNCQVLESKPGNSSVSIYAKARSWIDPRRLVPLRIEKYSHSGELIRRIEITRIARDEKHNPIPAGLTVHGLRKNTVTVFNGARIDQDVTFTDDDFKPASVLH
jgi:hypothetical protein